MPRHSQASAARCSHDGFRQSPPLRLRPKAAIGDYAARSISWATRHTSTDPVAEQVHTALAAAPDGLTRTQLRDLFARNLPATRLDAALTALGAAGRAQRRRLATAGRPAEIWVTTTHP